jgi:hypothetical protein
MWTVETVSYFSSTAGLVDLLGRLVSQYGV